MENTTQKKESFMTLTPEELILFVDKYVRVQLIKNYSFMGFVNSIDPISYSIILSVPQEDAFKTVLVPGHAIFSITEEKTNVSPPVRRTVATTNDNASMKGRVMAWLKWNLLPASEDGDKIIFGNATLLPPYGVEDICTDNPMVVMQMTKIIEAMPQDFAVPKIETV